MLLGRVLCLVATTSVCVACKPKDEGHAIDEKVRASVARIEKRLEEPVPATPSPPGTGVRRELVVNLRRQNFEDCMWLAHIDGASTVVRDAALLARYKRLCEHDMQVSTLRQLADLAEAARKANPTADMLPDCAASDVLISSDELKKYKTADSESEALEARFTAACAPAPADSAPAGSAPPGSAASGSAPSGSAPLGTAAVGSAAP
jgi:hypothetical protein